MPEYTEELLDYFQAGQLRLPIQTYPFAAVQTAQGDMESRRPQGKVVLF